MGRRKRSWGFLPLLVYVFFFCLQARVLYSQDQVCSHVDLKALEGFVKGLDSVVIYGFNTSSSSSITTTNCCEWPGISSDSTRRVVGLNLSNMDLEGVVSSSLAEMDHMRLLDLSNNSLEGVVPPQLFRLPFLNLSLNEFSGVIPMDSYLPSIQDFYVSFHSFSGNHPGYQNSAFGVGGGHKDLRNAPYVFPGASW